MKNAEYIEAIAIPGIEDFGFFDYFYGIAENNFLPKGCYVGRDLKKQRSIVISDDCMYVCQFVKSKYTGTQEVVLKLDWKRKEMTYPQGEIPQAVKYRTSSEVLFMTIMVTIMQIDVSKMITVNSILENSGKNIYYDLAQYKFYRRGSSLPLSWTEVAMELTGDFIQ